MELARTRGRIPDISGPNIILTERKNGTGRLGCYTLIIPNPKYAAHHLIEFVSSPMTDALERIYFRI